MCVCEQKIEMNLFFMEFQIEYGVFDFIKIRLEYYEFVFLKGIEEQNVEIKVIVDNFEEFIFENIIVVLDKSGGILVRVSGVFFVLIEVDINDLLMVLNEKMVFVFLEYSDNIYLNQDLYKWVVDVY